MSEQDYIAGSKRVWLLMLQQCIANLREDEEDVEATTKLEIARIMKEREETRLALMEMAEEYGVEIPVGLYMADIVKLIRKALP